MSQLGTIFRNRREELNLTLAEVSRNTNIRVNILDALEKGKNSILPATYLRSFSKTYWQYLQLPQEDFERVFAESGIMPVMHEQSFIGTLINPEKEKEQKVVPPTPLKTIQAPKYSPRLVSGLISASMILIALIGVYYIFIKDFIDDTPVEPGSETSTPAEIQDNTKNTSDGGGGLISLFEEGTPADSIVLEAYSQDSTWFTINADGQKSEEVILPPGQQRRWTATEYFKLSISNNGGVIFKRNGQQLESLGKKGTVVREVKITSDDVTTSAMPYQEIKENPAPSKPVASTQQPKAANKPLSTKPVVKKTTDKKLTDKKVLTKSTSSVSNSKVSPSKNKTSEVKSKKIVTDKSKTTASSKSKSTSSKKMNAEKAKASDKKTKTTKASSKEVTKNKKAPATKEAAKKKSEPNKVDAPKPIQIGNTRR